MQAPSPTTISDEKRSMKAGPSKMAEGIALQKLAGLKKPEDERICSDPFTVCFVSPGILVSTEIDPEPMEKSIFPGPGNSIRVRVRYFDDFVEYIQNSAVQQGNSLQGNSLNEVIPDREAGAFFASRGFSKICNVTDENYGKWYFHGKNVGSQFNDHPAFVSAEES